MPVADEHVRIGLEAHCQITSLKGKLFCSCPADYRGKEPNKNICPVCMGLPGTLPVLNERAIKEALKVAIALNCTIPKEVLFFRKNYFYPDMPKNFQISQYDRAGGVPIATGGSIAMGGSRAIRIRRIQLEEDPARLSYDGTITSSTSTLVDYNRAGIALLEIVSEPDIEGPRQAREFLQRLRSVLEHLGVCDGSLDGSMRCDANISLGGGRVEVKNISSFKEVERALSFEITRQKARLRGGLKVLRETRHWDDVRRVTVSLRVKEEEEDYRYFPEPDLVPVRIAKPEVERVRVEMPELPDTRRRRFIKEYGFSKQSADVLTGNKALADFFEECLRHYYGPRRIGNWLAVDVLAYLKRGDYEMSEMKTAPQGLARLAELVDKGIVSENAAKSVLYDMMTSGRGPDAIIAERGLEKVSEHEYIAKAVDRVFEENAKAVLDALTNQKAIHYLMGQLMRATKGKADPALAREALEERLSLMKGEVRTLSMNGQKHQPPKKAPPKRAK